MVSRKISSNYIYTPNGFLKNAIITFSSDGHVLDISESKEKIQEIENLEFYNGVLVPAFVDAFCLLSHASSESVDIRAYAEGSIDKLRFDLGNIKRSLNHLEAFATIAAININSSPEKTLSDIIRIENKTILEFKQFASMDIDSNCYGPYVYSSAMAKLKIGDLYALFSHRKDQLCIGTGSLSTHKRLSILDELKLIQIHNPSFGLHDLIGFSSTNASKAFGLSSLGSFDIGNKPGAVLLSDIDFELWKLTESTKVKLLIR